jgi:hypothetical protein
MHTAQSPLRRREQYPAPRISRALGRGFDSAGVCVLLPVTAHTGAHVAGGVHNKEGPAGIFRSSGAIWLPSGRSRIRNPGSCATDSQNAVCPTRD